MARHPFRSLLRLQNLALADARRALAGCIGRESLAEQALLASKAKIITETEAASRSDCDSQVEEFASWLAHGRRAVEQSEAVLRAATVEAATARAAVTLARVAARLTENLLDRHLAQDQLQASRREQATFDELRFKPSPFPVTR
jgi:hypothetical protein